MILKKSTIKCSVGILTHNSEKNLRRALDSVKDFSEIVVSDGGSTDHTLDIARGYGCKIIDQYSKNHPGPASFHPITNFSTERNRLLAAATEDWFFYIDSDEYISDTLHDEILSVTSNESPDYYAYEIPIGLQSPDAGVTYIQWKQTHQVRFFNHRIIGGEFEKAMHERYVFDREKFDVGRLDGKWFVPVSKPDFKTYSKVVSYRIGVMIQEHPPQNLRDVLSQGVIHPAKRFLGMIYRNFMVRLFYSWNKVVPLSHMRNLCFSYLVTFKIVTKLYFFKEK